VISNDEINLIESVYGWIDPQERDLLYNLARTCDGWNCIVEVGSFHGKSTACLGLGSRAGPKVKVYAIDPHEGVLTGSNSSHEQHPPTFDIFKRNMSRLDLDDIVVPIVSTSAEAVKTFLHPVGLVFIDGCHDELFALADVREWSKKLETGGLIAVHDSHPKSSWMGPRNAFKSCILETEQFEFLGFTGSIGLARKKGVTQTEQDHLFGIVVLTYNRLELLKTCIDRIFVHTKKPFKLYVVDNHSTDGTQQYLEDLHTQGKLFHIRMDSNIGVLARNVAFKQIAAPFIVQVDDDSAVCVDWDQACLDLFEKDSSIGLVCHQGAVITEWPRLEVTWKNGFVDVATGFFMCFRNVGIIFDENLAGFWCEDLDLSLQFKEKGYRIYSLRDLCSHASARTEPVDEKLFARNHEYVYNKWKDKISSLNLESR
jgi:predicted O-methyltransferase YrrM